MRPDPLYDEDFVAWTEREAGRLRLLQIDRWNGPLDLERLAEEVEDLGQSQRDAARGQIRRIIEHLLKLEHSPADAPRAGWRYSIADARAVLDDKLTMTLRRDIEQNLSRLYAQAAEQARLALTEYNEPIREISQVCTYCIDDLLRSGWYGDRDEV